MQHLNYVFWLAGAVLQMFSGLITIVMRSMVSKCVAKDELAKAFSFVSIGMLGINYYHA